MLDQTTRLRLGPCLARWDGQNHPCEGGASVTALLRVFTRPGQREDREANDTAFDVSEHRW